MATGPLPKASAAELFESAVVAWKNNKRPTSELEKLVVGRLNVLLVSDMEDVLVANIRRMYLVITDATDFSISDKTHNVAEPFLSAFSNATGDAGDNAKYLTTHLRDINAAMVWGIFGGWCFYTDKKDRFFDRPLITAAMRDAIFKVAREPDQQAQTPMLRTRRLMAWMALTNTWDFSATAAGRAFEFNTTLNNGMSDIATHFDALKNQRFATKDVADLDIALAVISQQRRWDTRDTLCLTFTNTAAYMEWLGFVNGVWSPPPNPTEPCPITGAVGKTFCAFLADPTSPLLVLMPLHTGGHFVLLCLYKHSGRLHFGMFDSNVWMGVPNSVYTTYFQEIRARMLTVYGMADNSADPIVTYGNLNLTQVHATCGLLVVYVMDCLCTRPVVGDSKKRLDVYVGAIRDAQADKNTAATRKPFIVEDQMTAYLAALFDNSPMWPTETAFITTVFALRADLVAEHKHNADMSNMQKSAAETWPTCGFLSSPVDVIAFLATSIETGRQRPRLRDMLRNQVAAMYAADIAAYLQIPSDPNTPVAMQWRPTDTELINALVVQTWMVGQKRATAPLLPLVRLLATTLTRYSPTAQMPPNIRPGSTFGYMGTLVTALEQANRAYDRINEIAPLSGPDAGAAMNVLRTSVSNAIVAGAATVTKIQQIEWETVIPLEVARMEQAKAQAWDMYQRTPTDASRQAFLQRAMDVVRVLDRVFTAHEKIIFEAGPLAIEDLAQTQPAQEALTTLVSESNRMFAALLPYMKTHVKFAALAATHAPITVLSPSKEVQDAARALSVETDNLRQKLANMTDDSSSSDSDEASASSSSSTDPISVDDDADDYDPYGVYDDVDTTGLNAFLRLSEDDLNITTSARFTDIMAHRVPTDVDQWDTPALRQSLVHAHFYDTALRPFLDGLMRGVAEVRGAMDVFVNGLQALSATTGIGIGTDRILRPPLPTDAADPRANVYLQFFEEFRELYIELEYVLENVPSWAQLPPNERTWATAYRTVVNTHITRWFNGTLRTQLEETNARVVILHDIYEAVMLEDTIFDIVQLDNQSLYDAENVAAGDLSRYLAIAEDDLGFSSDTLGALMHDTTPVDWYEWKARIVRALYPAHAEFLDEFLPIVRTFLDSGAKAYRDALDVRAEMQQLATTAGFRLDNDADSTLVAQPNDVLTKLTAQHDDAPLFLTGAEYDILITCAAAVRASSVVIDRVVTGLNADGSPASEHTWPVLSTFIANTRIPTWWGDAPGKLITKTTASIARTKHIVDNVLRQLAVLDRYTVVRTTVQDLVQNTGGLDPAFDWQTATMLTVFRRMAAILVLHMTAFNGWNNILVIDMNAAQFQLALDSHPVIGPIVNPRLIDPIFFDTLLDTARADAEVGDGVRFLSTRDGTELRKHIESGGLFDSTVRRVFDTLADNVNTTRAQIATAGATQLTVLQTAVEAAHRDGWLDGTYRAPDVGVLTRAVADLAVAMVQDDARAVAMAAPTQRLIGAWHDTPYEVQWTARANEITDIAAKQIHATVFLDILRVFVPTLTAQEGSSPDAFFAAVETRTPLVYRASLAAPRHTFDLQGVWSADRTQGIVYHYPLVDVVPIAFADTVADLLREETHLKADFASGDAVVRARAIGILTDIVVTDGRVAQVVAERSVVAAYLAATPVADFASLATYDADGQRVLAAFAPPNVVRAIVSVQLDDAVAALDRLPAFEAQLQRWLPLAPQAFFDDFGGDTLVPAARIVAQQDDIRDQLSQTTEDLGHQAATAIQLATKFEAIRDNMAVTETIYPGVAITVHLPYHHQWTIAIAGFRPAVLDTRYIDTDRVLAAYRVLIEQTARATRMGGTPLFNTVRGYLDGVAVSQQRIQTAAAVIASVQQTNADRVAGGGGGGGYLQQTLQQFRELCDWFVELLEKQQLEVSSLGSTYGPLTLRTLDAYEDYFAVDKTLRYTARQLMPTQLPTTAREQLVFAARQEYEIVGFLLASADEERVLAATVRQILKNLFAHGMDYWLSTEDLRMAVGDMRARNDPRFDKNTVFTPANVDEALAVSAAQRTIERYEDKGDATRPSWWLADLDPTTPGAAATRAMFAGSPAPTPEDMLLASTVFSPRARYYARVEEEQQLSAFAYQQQERARLRTIREIEYFEAKKQHK